MDYSERFKRYSRSDSKDSRSKLGSKDSRHASIPSKPGTMDSSNTAYTQGSRTSRKESGEPNGKLRDSDMNRAQRENGDFNGRLRESGEMNSKHRETDYSRSYREGGEYNGNKSVRGGGESNGSKQAPKTKGRQTKDPQFQSGRQPMLNVMGSYFEDIDLCGRQPVVCWFLLVQNCARLLVDS